MNDSTLEASPLFAARRFAAQAAVDLAIQRVELVASISRRRRALERVRLDRDDAVTDAQLRLAMAVTALEDFDRRAGRAPA